MNFDLTFVLGALALGGLIGYLVRQQLAARNANSVEQQIKERLVKSEDEARGLVLDAKAKAANFFDEVKKEERERKGQIDRLEERLIKKEEALEKEVRDLENKRTAVVRDHDRVTALQKEVGQSEERLRVELEKVAELSREQAKEKLIQEVEHEYSKDLALTIQKLEQQRRDTVEQKSVEIITTAMQRFARSHVADLTTSVFHLSNEDLKGKIIGREGRNIRALERATGVEFVIDEAPDSVVISSFDPMRREIARIALEKLIKDGRIQPAKIEEKVAEAQQEIAKRVMELGEQAALEIGIVDLPKEILQLVGRLNFRTSYGQNMLVHSIEMAHIAGMLAAELGLNVEVAKKGALLHDIGKAIDHEVQGTHIEIGRKLLQKYNIDERVIRAMESHHEDYPYSVPEAYIVTTADILSGARPGARRDNLENYIKRLGDLEKIAASFEGVKRAYALSAGREIRVFVTPEKIDDFGALQLSRNIADRIQSEMKYPGEIKVNVIREVRAVEYAR